MRSTEPEALVTYPHTSRRSAVLASNGVVATSHPLAAQAGLGVLRDGGSAVDAAIATAAALTVVEPTSNGLGSDAFALVWHGGRLHGLNGSGRWPVAASVTELTAAGYGSMPSRGWWPVTVPGAVDTWHELHDRFGRLPPSRLLEPAIGYAEDGFPVSPVVARMWAQAAPVLSRLDLPGTEDWATVFAPGGRAPHAGERWSSPAMATGLRTLAQNGFRDFYEGDVAKAICAFAESTGGLLGPRDLASHRADWVDPIGIRFRGIDVWEIPPNGQGIAALLALGMLDHLEKGDEPQVDAGRWHRQIEAMKLAFSDSDRFVADQQHVSVPVEGLLDGMYLADRAAGIGDRAGSPSSGQPPGGGTVYLCAADRDGQMVSFIQSNYMGFGSGVVVPSHGISLQNRGAGFTLAPDHPNAPAPGKRPRHTIIPGFLTRDGAPLGPFGVMGGEMQPQGHLQVVAGLVDFGLNAQAALDAPRWRVDRDWTVLVEQATPRSVIDGLRDRGHRVEVAADEMAFGRGQVILRSSDGVYSAGSEPRADGCAAGF